MRIDVLKEALTRPPNPSKPQRLQQLQREAELGNCRTSQLLRQIQQLASCTEKLRQSLGARALPSKIGRNQADRRECFVRNGCPQDRETSCLTHCGHPASNCHITLAEASSVPNLLDIRTDISHLASTVTALQSSGSLKNTAAWGRKERQLCWHHRKFCGTSRNTCATMRDIGKRTEPALKATVATSLEGSRPSVFFPIDCETDNHFLVDRCFGCVSTYVGGGGASGGVAVDGAGVAEADGEVAVGSVPCSITETPI
ncbi:hypothetical protein HPB51_013368 [Rhipicephalus microplus]|uniref:Uncharacterized protein n=1 Tax=Rhipicephalus microplus TaxID=6941 RepID=A0A9J6E1G4_RHIMP|nr:hypothetical protein HPB51_013368 [Rhipicephalus microplus]